MFAPEIIGGHPYDGSTALADEPTMILSAANSNHDFIRVDATAGTKMHDNRLSVSPTSIAIRARWCRTAPAASWMRGRIVRVELNGRL
jgi:hypothetical protein